MDREPINFYIDTMARGSSFYMPYEHTHSLIELYYLQRGECKFVVNSACVSLKAGDILLIRPGDRHSTTYTGQDASIRTNLFIDPRFLPRQLLELVPQIQMMCAESCRIVLDKYSLLTLQELFRKITNEQISPGPYAKVTETLYVCEIFMLLIEHGQISHNIFVPIRDMESDIRLALHYIDTMYPSPLTLQDIAKKLQLNTSYFSHKFHVATGYTFKEYLNNVRIRNAANQLLVTDDSITRIALNCGFSSSNYFKDLFKKSTGMTPREYRQKAAVSNKLGYGHTPEE